MFKQLLGDPNARKLRRYAPLVSEINLLEEDISNFTDDQLRSEVVGFREKLGKLSTSDKQLEMMDEILPQVFAVVREAGKRVLGMRHFDVQLLGGMVLHEGQIAEMKTG